MLTALLGTLWHLTAPHMAPRQTPCALATRYTAVGAGHAHVVRHGALVRPAAHAAGAPAAVQHERRPLRQAAVALRPGRARLVVIHAVLVVLPALLLLLLRRLLLLRLLLLALRSRRCGAAVLHLPCR